MKYIYYNLPVFDYTMYAFFYIFHILQLCHNTLDILSMVNICYSN